MGVTKIRTTDPNEENILGKLEDETRGTRCTKLQWNTHQDRDEINPDDSTAAIVVDLRNITAAIRIFETNDDQFIDGVGIEEAGKLVIVPWQSGWWYYCTGSPRVGHIR